MNRVAAFGLVGVALFAGADLFGKEEAAPDDDGGVILSAEELRRVSAEKPYVITPLGEEGHLKLNRELPNRATYRAKKVFEPGFRLFGAGGPDAVIVPERGVEAQRPMNELRWHLEQMIGREVRLVSPKEIPPDVPVLTVRFTDVPGAAERSVVRIDGRTVFIEGTDDVGISHALTYFLESLGIRYLWPGPTGKIIPKKQDVFLPKGLALDDTPSLKMRRIRTYYGPAETMIELTKRKFGVDAPKAANRTRRLLLEEWIENRSFWAWHGVNDAKALPGGEPIKGGNYRWVHRFNDYYVRFGKDHPDWFAMQPDGTREQDNRPCFCMSNPGLVDQIAKETIEMFRFEPEVVSHSLCLPDGGYKCFCLCANCRRMDPKNSPRHTGMIFSPVRCPCIGYSYTDRVLAFNNAIAEKVVAACPGKMLSIYAYSSYVEPPMQVKPHPALLIVSVAGGNYIKPSLREKAYKSLAAWTTFGNRFVWRPNVLAGFRAQMPVNSSRWLFEDVENFKANGMIGTDFDCMNNMWATDGLNFYMLAKAHLNPDRLAYDDFYADYLAAAFGPAAPAMRKYYDLLAETYRLAADDKEAYDRKWADVEPARVREKGYDQYIRRYDEKALGAYLDEADRLAVGDGDVLKRLAFIRKGFELGLWEKRTAEAVWGKSPQLKDIRRGFAEFVRATWEENPLVLSLGGLAFYDGFLGRDPLGLADGGKK